MTGLRVENIARSFGQRQVVRDVSLHVERGQVAGLLGPNGAGKTVTIGPNVRISDGGSGFTLVTPEAVVDTSTGIVTGNKGVQGSGPLGTISASSYVIREQGGRVEFRGSGENKIRGTINAGGSNP